MALLDAIRRGRRAAERLMTDQCVIRRPTGRTIRDPETFVETPVLDVAYDPTADPHKGRCKVQTYEGHERTADVAGSTVTVQRSRVDLPVGALAAEVGDIVTMIAAVDPLLVGRSFRIVQEAPYKSHATAYRVFVDENVGQEVPPWPTA